jgi:hypothetical protein
MVGKSSISSLCSSRIAPRFLRGQSRHAPPFLGGSLISVHPPPSEEYAALEEAQKFLRLVENKKRWQETVSPVSSYRLRGFDAVGDPTRFSKENQASSTEED